MSDTVTIIISILAVNIALFGAIATLVIWAINKADEDIKQISTDVKAIGTRLDGHATRIDQLYKVIIDLMKK